MGTAVDRISAVALLLVTQRSFSDDHSVIFDFNQAAEYYMDTAYLDLSSSDHSAVSDDVYEKGIF